VTPTQSDKKQLKEVSSVKKELLDEFTSFKNLSRYAGNNA